MTMIRVCIIIPHVSAGYRGSFNQALLQARHLAMQGISIIVLSPSINERRHIFKFIKKVEDGVIFYVFNSRLMNNEFIRMAFMFVFAGFLSWKYDIFQIITSHFCYIGAFLTLALGKRFIVVSTSFRGYLVKPNIFNRLKIWALGQADVIVVKTDQLYNFYKENYPVKPRIVRVPNGIDFKKFHLTTSSERYKTRHNLGVEDKEKMLLFVGNIVKEKGVDLILEQYDKWTEEVGQQTKLFLVGDTLIDPNFSRQICDLIKKNKFDNNVFMPGPTDNIIGYYQAADILLLPSRREGFPNVVLEAMATGLACVVSNLCYTKDLIRSGDNGYVFNLDIPESFFNQVVYLLRNEKHCVEIGMRAYDTIRKLYSIDIVKEEYIKIYQTLLSG